MIHISYTMLNKIHNFSMMTKNSIHRLFYSNVCYSCRMFPDAKILDNCFHHVVE